MHDFRDVLEAMRVLRDDPQIYFLREPFVGIAVPGKLYGIMASGRPALFVGPERCESADAIHDAGCGAVIDPANGGAAERIAAQLRAWSTDAEAAHASGERGRAAFLATYERLPNCESFARVIERAWGAK